MAQTAQLLCGGENGSKGQFACRKASAHASLLSSRADQTGAIDVIESKTTVPPKLVSGAEPFFSPSRFLKFFGFGCNECFPAR